MKAAVVQLPASPDVAANLARAETLVRAAGAAGASLVVLPEAFATGYDAVPWREVAEVAGGPTHAALAAWARATGATVVGGAIVRSGGALHSAALVASPSGGIVARYDKRHLWRGERDVLTPGATRVVRATPAGATGLLVCYDIEFPEAAREAAASGARALAAPCAFTNPRIWDVATRARALENGVFVLAANLSGRFLGRSRIVAPDAEVLAEVAADDGFALATVDPYAYSEWRAEHPYADDLRRARMRDV